MDDELVKRLRNRRVCIQQSGSLDDFPLLKEAADAIEELSKQVELEHQSGFADGQIAANRKKLRWIPVTERLPSNSTKVLVLEFGRVEQAYTTTYTADGSLCWVVINGGSYHRISDADCPIKWWMPLPEPPKEE